MTQAKHSPGPWRVSVRHRVGIDGQRLGIDGRCDAIGWPQAIIYNAGMPHDPEALANAQLIATAPELLAALERVTKFFGDLPGWGRDAKEELDVARAAIVKANRRAP
jgi:hypothetical protein